MKFRKDIGRRNFLHYSTLGIPLSLALLLSVSSVHAEPSTANIVAVDQRLMDAERALLHSLSARSLTNVAPAGQPSQKSAGDMVVKTSAHVDEQVVKTVEKKGVKAASPETVKVAAPVADAPEKPSKGIVKGASCGDSEVLKNSNSNLRRELQASQQRIEDLERSLDQARSQLALTETELSRLSTRLETKNRASLGKYNLPLSAASTQSQQATATRSIEAARTKPSVSDVKPPAANTEMPVATVAVEKADLRLGPGKNHSALMAVPRGSRLVVETRQGEWYRVFAPSGERAWIHSGLVLFGDGASLLNDGTAARVKGFNPNDEEEAFRRVQRMAAGQ